jgi:hypothetical protein
MYAEGHQWTNNARQQTTAAFGRRKENLRYLYLSIASESSAITRVSTPATPEDNSTILLLIPLLAVCGKLTLLLAVCGKWTLLLAVCGMPAAGAGEPPPP